MEQHEENIRQGVDNLLNDHPKLDATHIHIEVSQTKVILKGRVDTDEEKQLAGKLAASFPGVTEMENHLHTGLGLTHALIETLSRLSAGDEEGKKKDEEK